MCICQSGAVSPIHRAVDTLLFNPTLLWFFWGMLVNTEGGREVARLGALPSGWQRGLLDHSCSGLWIRSLPRGLGSLGSAVLYADHSGRIAGAPESASAVSVLPLRGHSELQAASCGLSLHFSLPSSSVRPGWPTRRCFDADLSDVFVCCAGNPLLNYSCSIGCNFRGRDPGGLLMPPPCF